MEDSEKVIVNFVNENNVKRHELERLMTRFGVIQSSNCVLKYRRRRIVMKS